MDIFLSLLAGSSAKIYDDSVDNKLITNEFYLKMLETLQCYLLGAISINNFTFSIVTFIIIVCNYFGGKKEYSNPYEFSLVAMYPIFIILSYSKREYLNLFDWVIFLSLCLVLGLEPMFIKEDASPRKLVMRLLSAGFFIITMPFYYKLLSNGVFLTALYFLSYVTVSVGFQIYACSHMSFDEFSKQLFEGIEEFLSDILSACGFKQESSLKKLGV
jgi:hypothetical protein